MRNLSILDGSLCVCGGGGVNNTNKSCLEYSLQSMLISQSGSRKDVDIVPVCEKVKLLFSGLVHCVLIVVLLNLFIYFFYTKEFLELEYNLSSNSKNSPKKSLLCSAPLLPWKQEHERFTPICD